MDIDNRLSVFVQVKKDAEDNLEGIRTEADAKFQIINRILVDVLGWGHGEVQLEESSHAGYADYIIGGKDNPQWVIEAKRLGVIKLNTAEFSKIKHVKICGPVLKDASDGIEQAAYYATSKGLLLSVLSDGLKWIVFKPFIEGKQWRDLSAVVFPSLNAIEDSFSAFYELLAKPSVNAKIHKIYFDNIHENRTILSRELVAPYEKSKIYLVRKEGLALDLDSVFSTFFTKLTGEDDSEMLIDCFVESRESRIADFSLEKITSQVISGISRADQGVEIELTDLITTAVNVDKGQTVFIVGPTGAGKSTFLDRFFKQTLSQSIKSRCIVLRINCLDASGNMETFQSWMTEQLISKIENQNFEDGIPSYDDLQGLYFREYKQRSRGALSGLYNRDKVAFKENFGAFIEEQMRDQRESYLFRLLEDVVKNRKKLPIILIDNTDEFPLNYKEILFQFVHSLRRHAAHCLLIFPLTDKSAWSFSKTDIYKIYQPKSFFLPTPSPREIFRKRIEYIKKKLSSSESDSQKKSYFSNRGIPIEIGSISKFATILEDVFVDQDYASKLVGELSNYNIRSTLELSRRVITSPVFDIDSLVKSYITGTSFSGNYYQFMNALVKGDYEKYRGMDNGMIYSLFDVESEVIQSPLLRIRILKLLKETYNTSKSIDGKHLSVQSVVSYFDVCGVSDIASENALRWLLDTQLIEPFDVNIRELGSDQQVAITTSGSAHLSMAISNDVYIEQMALTTQLSNSDIAARIADIYESSDPQYQRLANIRKIFLDHVIGEDSFHMRIPIENENFSSQVDLANALKTKIEAAIAISDSDSDSDSDSLEMIEQPEVNSLVYSEVLATVQWFDKTKGFGFASIEDGKDIFIHVSVFQHDSKIESVSDGDRILCDVRREKKGLAVSKIHDLEVEPDLVEIADCKVVRAFPQRGYGFVYWAENKREAIFYYSLFKPSMASKIVEGFEFRAELKPSPSHGPNSFQVRKYIDDL